MKILVSQFALAQISAYLFHHIALIAKHQRGMVAQVAQQAKKQIELIVVLAFYAVSL